MADLIFYSNPQSRGQIAHWMLEELGEDYDTRWVAYGDEMKRAEYLAVNPMGKVPALEHRGANAVVTETAAICAYLAAAFPEKGLMPAGKGADLADYYRWLFFGAGPVEMALTARSLKWEFNAEQAGMVGFGSHDATLNAIEGHLADREYVCRGGFSAADVYLGSHLIWGMKFGTLESREGFKAYCGRLERRPAYQRAAALCERQAAAK